MVRVLVVDDSAFFRRRLTEILKADRQIEVVGTAADGQEALRKISELKPDVVTMDIEMPVMDGITAVRRIMERHPTPVLMFSSLTHEGAQATFDALEAGAADFLPKQLEEISRDRAEAQHQLCQRVRMLGQRGLQRTAKPPADVVARQISATTARSRAAGRYKLVVIGTSTGGPVALQQILKTLPADFPLPLLLVQHMPATFTGPFAQRLDQQCAITVKEAADGDTLAPGTALLAPGGRQMVLEARAGSAVVRIRDADPKHTYRPSVDITFSSVAEVFPGKALALVLTGMGADGREGARLLKKGGSTVWAQDEKSCVVYGMPAAVVEAALADQVLPLAQIGPNLAHAGM